MLSSPTALPPYVPPEYQVAYSMYPATFTNPDGSLVFEVTDYIRVGLSEEEFEFFARVVAAECNGNIDDDYQNQVAIACVVWNRTVSEQYGGTVTDVLTEYGQFSTVKHGDCNKKTNDLCRQAIVDAYINKPLPSGVIYFNSVGFSHGHKPYKKISDNYFSYE